MGHLARMLAQPDEGLMAELLRAYADEWFGHYNYYVASWLVRGPSSASISELLREKSQAALSRADRLAERIVQLGGEPVPKLTALVEHATDKPFKLPEDHSDVSGLLRAVLDAERTSMRTHRHLHDLTQMRDPITATLALSLLAEAEAGEQAMERLLGDDASEMDGT